MMSCLVRKLLAGIVALWLPLCCCQVMAVVSSANLCCAAQEDSHKPAHSCCSEGDSDECCSEGSGESSDEMPCGGDCVCCPEKAPPPPSISLDSFFIATAIPFELILAPSQIDPSIVHATEVRGRWDDPPPLPPPTLPSESSRRCSALSLWLI